MIVAYPPFNQPWTAWGALVPWLILLRRVGPRAAFGWSWLIGVLFFLGSLWWLIHVTLVGWLILCAYLALYFGVFGWLVRIIAPSPQPPAPNPDPLQARPTVCGRGSTVYTLIGVPSLWVALEYARSHLLSGFGWNLLAYSQTPWLPVIQIADVTGAWGVSFVIVLVNVAIAGTLTAYGPQPTATDPLRRTSLGGLACAVGLVAGVVGYGLLRLAQFGGPPAGVVRVAVVQGNIPQEQKWDDAFVETILSRYESLTREAATGKPDLIVWPETAVPGYLGADAPLTLRLLTLSKSLGVPLVVGAPRAHETAGGTWQTTNSAALVDGGAIRQWYDKLHLVPLGEFIPGERLFPWLREALPPIGDFIPGHASTVFHMARQPSARQPYLTSRRADEPTSQDVAFSVLVCFEDVFPELARGFVREGAQLLLVITNDAWFGPTAAAYQHAQASAFRAVELRVPIARAANTGWSGCLDAAGRWVGSVRDAQGRELFVPGTTTCELPFWLAHSIYLLCGEWFALACLLFSIAYLLVRRIFSPRP